MIVCPQSNVQCLVSLSVDVVSVGQILVVVFCLIIRLGAAEIIYHSSWGGRSYFRRSFISSAGFSR